MIIGIDASTKSVGWCLLNDDGSLYDVGYIWLDKIKNEYDKFERLIEEFQPLREHSELFQVYIEAPLQRSNNQRVVNILQRWNGMVSIAAFGIFQTQPILIPEADVRKINDVVIPKGVKGPAKKKFALHYVQSLDIIPEDKWELKRTGNPCDWSYDMTDAFLVAKEGFLQKNSVQE